MKALAGWVTLLLVPLGPAANADPPATGSGVVTIAVDALVTFALPAGDRVHVVSPPAHGTATLTPTGIVYAPASGYVGPDTFAYELCDHSACALEPVTLNVIVAPGVADDIRIANADSTVDASVAVAAPARAAIDLPPMNGTATVTPDGHYRYTPRPGFTGRDSFTVKGCLPSLTPPVCGSGTVTVTVLPVALPDTATVTAGQLTEIPVQDNDIGSAVTTAVVAPPAHGTAEVAPSGAIEYQSDPTYAGADALRYQVCSMISPDVCALAAVSVTVRAAAPAPLRPGSPRRPMLPSAGTAVGWLFGWAVAGLLLAALTLAIAARRLRDSPQ